MVCSLQVLIIAINMVRRLFTQKHIIKCCQWTLCASWKNWMQAERNKLPGVWHAPYRINYKHLNISKKTLTDILHLSDGWEKWYIYIYIYISNYIFQNKFQWMVVGCGRFSSWENRCFYTQSNYLAWKPKLFK